MFLSDDIQKQLRNEGIITVNEVVKKEGDLYIAVNALDQNRRITSINSALIVSLKTNAPNSDSGRGLLKGYHGNKKRNLFWARIGYKT